MIALMIGWINEPSVLANLQSCFTVSGITVCDGGSWATSPVMPSTT